jgi:hypothetical protein
MNKITRKQLNHIKDFLKESWCVDQEEVETQKVTVKKEDGSESLGMMFTLHDSERGKINVTLNF